MSNLSEKYTWEHLLIPAACLLWWSRSRHVRVSDILYMLLSTSNTNSSLGLGQWFVVLNVRCKRPTWPWTACERKTSINVGQDWKGDRPEDVESKTVAIVKLINSLWPLKVSSLLLENTNPQFHLIVYWRMSLFNTRRSDSFNAVKLLLMYNYSTQNVDQPISWKLGKPLKSC